MHVKKIFKKYVEFCKDAVNYVYSSSEDNFEKY